MRMQKADRLLSKSRRFGFSRRVQISPIHASQIAQQSGQLKATGKARTTSVAVVIMDDATQDLASLNRPVCFAFCGRHMNLLTQHLMGTHHVAVRDIFLQNTFGMGRIDKKYVVKTLFTYTPHPALSECIRVGRMIRRRVDFNPVRDKNRHRCFMCFKLPPNLPDLLGHPHSI